MIQLPSDGITPQFRLLPVPGIDQSWLHMHEVPLLQ